MKTIFKTLLISLALAGTAAQTFASTYRLDFSGQTTDGTFSGYLILDFSVSDALTEDNRGYYSNIVTDVSLDVDGTLYSSANSIVNFGSTSNDLAGVGDSFGVGVEVVNDAGESNLFALQFQNEGGLLFTTDALPDSFNLSDFDAFTPGNSNSTGAILPMLNAMGMPEIVALDSANLQPVPLPAGIVLMLSAVAVLTRFRANKA